MQSTTQSTAAEVELKVIQPTKAIGILRISPRSTSGVTNPNTIAELELGPRLTSAVGPRLTSAVVGPRLTSAVRSGFTEVFTEV